MLNDLKTRLLTGWGFTRFVRLGLAAIVITEAFKSSELIFGLLGAVLLFQAAFNYGCCGTSGCDSTSSFKKSESSTTKIKEVSFEEIK